MTFGFHIDTDGGERVAEGGGRPERYPEHERTNNTAEFEALIAGLTWLVQSKGLMVDRLTIYGDSMLVVNVVNAKWKGKKTHLKKLADLAKELLKRIDAGHIELSHIPREENAEADAIANRHCLRPNKQPIPAKSAWPAPWES